MILIPLGSVIAFIAAGMGLSVCTFFAGRLQMSQHVCNGDPEETCECYEEGFNDARMSGTGMRRECSDRDASLPAPLVSGPEGEEERGLPGVGQRSGRPQPGAPGGNEGRDRLDDAPEADWGDELATMRIDMAVDHATEVLTAPQPAAGSFEYMLLDWAARQDARLAGQVAEMAEQKASWT